MRTQLKRIFGKNPELRRLVTKLYGLRSLSFRIVRLTRRSLPQTVLRAMESDARYNDIVADLLAYTGFSVEELTPHLLRHRGKHVESELNWYAPTDEQELTWFYRCSSAYLFANAVHPYDSALDTITEGKVLDYGAGIGCNTIGLAKRGIAVDFVEIGRLQADFINFRAERHKLKNVREVRPYHEGRFDPVLCIRGLYDAIVALDVLEHIPNYHVVVIHDFHPQ